MSTDDSQGFTPQNGPSNNCFQTYFEIGKYRQLCTNPSTGKSYYNWLIEPYQWNAGTKYDHPKYVPPATHCTPEHKKGDNFTKHTTTAKTIKAGYSIGAISGTAETGYSKTASIKFVFHEPGVLCGHDSTPPNAPGFLEAGSDIEHELPPAWRSDDPLGQAVSHPLEDLGQLVDLLHVPPSWPGMANSPGGGLLSGRRPSARW